MCTGATFPTDEFIVYKELETEVTAFVGESVEVSFVSAIPMPFIYTFRLDGSTLGINTQTPFGRVDTVVSPSGGDFTSTIELTVVAGSFDIPLRTTTLTVYGMLSDYRLTYSKPTYSLPNLSLPLPPQRQLPSLTALQMTWTSLWGMLSPSPVQWLVPLLQMWCGSLMEMK